MKRRDLLKAGLTASAAFAAPYILPSGRLFAASGLVKLPCNCLLVRRWSKEFRVTQVC